MSPHRSAARKLAAPATAFAVLAGTFGFAPAALAYSSCTGGGSAGAHCYGNISEPGFSGNGGYASAIYAVIDVQCSYISDPANNFGNSTIWAGLTNGTTFEVGQGASITSSHTDRYFYSTRYGGGFGYGEWDTTIRSYNQVGYAVSIAWNGSHWLVRANGTTILTANGPSSLINTAQAGVETTSNTDQFSYDVYGIGRKIASSGTNVGTWPGADLTTYYDSPPMRSTPIVASSGEIASYQTRGPACASLSSAAPATAATADGAKSAGDDRAMAMSVAGRLLATPGTVSVLRTRDTDSLRTLFGDFGPAGGPFAEDLANRDLVVMRVDGDIATARAKPRVRPGTVLPRMGSAVVVLDARDGHQIGIMMTPAAGRPAGPDLSRLGTPAVLDVPAGALTAAR